MEKSDAMMNAEAAFNTANDRKSFLDEDVPNLKQAYEDAEQDRKNQAQFLKDEADFDAADFDPTQGPPEMAGDEDDSSNNDGSNDSSNNDSSSNDNSSGNDF